ncbi:MAG: RNA repair domain-containing protein [Candidatus Ranarchaeia archaeon]
MAIKKRVYRSPRNILNKLKWDKRHNLENYQITYIHRGAPDNTRTIKASSIETHRYVFSTETSEIPYHRILQIKNKFTGNILYSKTPPKTSGL